MLYAAHFHQPDEVDRVFRDLIQTLDMEGRLDAHARQLVDTVLAHEERIDAIFGPLLRNWTIARLAHVDRCVIRLGVGELLYFEETPSSVVLDEAVELAKRFGGPSSGPFVNGVLDAVLREMRAGRIEAE